MTDIYLPRDVFNQASADVWARQATDRANLHSSVIWASGAQDVVDQAQQAAQAELDRQQAAQDAANKAAADQWAANASAQYAMVNQPPPAPDATATPPAPDTSTTPPDAPQPTPAPDTAQQPSDTTDQQAATVGTPQSVPMSQPVPMGDMSTAAPSPAPAASATPAPNAPVTAPMTPASGYEAQARAAAQRYGIDPNLYVAQLQQESGLEPFNPDGSVKVSPAGARGIAQFMPGTAQGLGINPDDPAQAIDAGARYMANLIQQNGGDTSKALAAYNAGQGNVDKFGGVPPFAETQAYVKNITDAASKLAGNAGSAVQQAANTVQQAVQNVGSKISDRVSQFGLGLSSADAMAFCGPDAAIAFAQTFGRNPTIDEAKQLAQQVGWDPNKGMAGVGSEMQLLDKLGIQTTAEGYDPSTGQYTGQIDWNHVAQDVASGNPVIIDTPGHYFYVSGVRQGPNGQQEFNFGSSATDLKASGGNQWFTPAQLANLGMGAPRAAVYADHPLANGPSVAEAPSPNQPATMGANQPGSPPPPDNTPPPQLQSMWDRLGQGISDVFKGVFGGAATTPAPEGGGFGGPSGPLQSPQDFLNTTSQAANQAVQSGDVFRTVTAPIQAQNAVLGAAGNVVRGLGNPLDSAQTMQDLAEKYPSRVPGLPDTSQMTPEDLQAYQNATMAVGGLEASPGAEFDQFGVEKGFVPPHPLNPPPPVAEATTDAGAGLIPNANRARAAAADQQFAAAGGTGGRAGRLAQTFPTSTTTDVVQQMLDTAKTNGADPAVIDRMQSVLDELNGAGKPPPPPPTTPTVPDAAPPMPPTPPTGGTSPWDYIRALRVGSLAGGVPTLAHITLNAPLQTAWKLASDLPLTATRPETVPLEFMGAWQGLRGWATNAATTLGRPGAIAEGIGGPAGQAVETGLLGLVKTHPVLQDMARQIGSGMEMWRQAGVAASDEGLARFSPQWWDRVQQLTQEPTQQMANAAAQVGNTFALRGPMGQTGTAVGKFLQNSRVGQFIVPFFNIGYHVASQGIERSPFGFIGRVTDAMQGKPIDAAALRNNVIGTGLAFEAYQQAAQGNITGNGPDNPQLRAQLTAQGWQPDSIRIGGRYFSLHMLGPLGWPLAEAANLYEATHTGDQRGYAAAGATPGDQFANYVGRMAQFGENETFLRSVGQLLQAAGGNMQDFTRLGTAEASSLLESLIPQGALLANAASAQDPIQRRVPTGDIGAAIQNRLPGQRENLPARLTPTGQTEPNPQQGLGILLPRNAIAAPDPVIQALGAAGIGAAYAPKTVAINSRYSIDLTPQEQQQFEQIRGQTLKEMLSDVVNDPDFKTLSVDRQRQILQRAQLQAADAARRSLLSAIPDAELESRATVTADQRAANRVTVGAP